MDLEHFPQRCRPKSQRFTQLSAKESCTELLLKSSQYCGKCFKQTHFVTFCCYHRHTLFLTDLSKQTFQTALERIRRSFQLYIYGYVIIAGARPPASFRASARHSSRCTQISQTRRFTPFDRRWQKRYYDFNIRNHPQFVEKLRYMHRNPVKRGLCE
jgi:putative transposase